MLQVEDVRKHFGPEAVLAGVSFEVRPGERVGLVGPNGTGKTTLLKILAAKEEADGGHWSVHPAVKLRYLEQRPDLRAGRTLREEAESALDDMIALQREALDVAGELGQTADAAQRRRLAARYDHLQQELHRHDAYNLDHKIDRVLQGLGFGRERFPLAVEALSGGEQNRLMLAKLLLAEPDLMLLDEPSNHLDIEATEWLEDYLVDSPAAMILVSHDRYFLDKVTNRTLELFHSTVDEYSGNFSAYWRQKGERLLVQQRTYEKQQIEIARTKEFIRRNKYGQKHAQAEDRRKKLERIVPVDPPREIATPPMGFPQVARSGDVVLRAEHLQKAYDRPLLENVTLDIGRGERWGVLGPNGSGKTTLLRCLVGQLELDAGEVILGHGVKIGYFDQHLDALADDDLVVDAIRPDRGEFVLQKRRDLLARFGLSGETALQAVGSLSGGERCRAALARLAASEANLLVLDEPTNHLDLWARDALERSLANFEGTVLFVSHDRYFINRVADHLLVVEPPRFRVIEGNYATYLHLVDRGLAREAVKADASQKAPKTSKPVTKGNGPSGPSDRKRRFPYRKVEDLEKDIFEKETHLKQLHATLAEPETHRNGDRVRQLKAEIARQEESLQALYAHWDEATELNW